MSIADVLHGKGHHVVKVRTTDTVHLLCVSCPPNGSARWSWRINGCVTRVFSQSVTF